MSEGLKDKHVHRGSSVLNKEFEHLFEQFATRLNIYLIKIVDNVLIIYLIMPIRTSSVLSRAFNWYIYYVYRKDELNVLIVTE